MSRRHFTFGCEGSEIFATLDGAAGDTGLLLVSGGNEVRAGAWGGQARLAALVARAGHPVLRFDRRGVGDSEGGNGGFETSGPDIAAALAAFRKEVPGLRQVIAFGNCDAASALMLAGGAGCDGLVLANPWTFDNDRVQTPPAAIRAHYARRLLDPSAWKRLFGGKVALARLAGSLASAAAQTRPSGRLMQRIQAGLADFGGSVSILISGRDRTGQAFLAGWDTSDIRLKTCPHADHSFSSEQAQAWLLEQVLAALEA